MQVVSCTNYELSIWRNILHQASLDKGVLSLWVCLARFVRSPLAKPIIFELAFVKDFKDVDRDRQA
jgi:hypothetical protein